MKKNKHIGSSIDDLLKEEGIYEKVEAQAIKEIGEGQLIDIIEAQKSPNATTRKAIAELETGKGKRFASVGALMADLNAKD